MMMIDGGGGGTNNSNREFIEQSHLPFQGILGIQQGADVAAMLPLLLSSHKMVMAADNEEELEVEEEEMKECIYTNLIFFIDY